MAASQTCKSDLQVRPASQTCMTSLAAEARGDTTAAGLEVEWVWADPLVRRL
jgi:hypothetical protein